MKCPEHLTWWRSTTKTAEVYLHTHSFTTLQLLLIVWLSVGKKSILLKSASLLKLHFNTLSSVMISAYLLSSMTTKKTGHSSISRQGNQIFSSIHFITSSSFSSWPSNVCWEWSLYLSYCASSKVRISHRLILFIHNPTHNFFFFIVTVEMYSWQPDLLMSTSQIHLCS